MCTPKVKVSRRSFLKNCAAGFGALALGELNPAASIFPATAHAAQGKKLLTVFFRGGPDWPFFIGPKYLSEYYDVRPTLANDAERLDLGSRYSIHQNLASLKTIYDEGNLAVFKNSGYANTSRSHQQSIEYWSAGVASSRSNVGSGFLARIGAQNYSNLFDLISLAQEHELVRGGGYKGTYLRRLRDFNWNDRSSAGRQARDYIASALDQWTVKNGLSKKTIDAYGTAFNAENQILDALAGANFPGVPMSSNGFEGSLADAFTAFTRLDARAAVCETGGFDTHSSQSMRGASLASTMNAIGKFITNCKAAGIWNDVTILCIGDFGRTRKENGSGGTDHGNSGQMWVMGGKVKGGFYGGDYIASDFLNNLVNARVNMLDVYRPLVAHLGYDPDEIFESDYPGKTTFNFFNA